MTKLLTTLLLFACVAEYVWQPPTKATCVHKGNYWVCTCLGYVYCRADNGVSFDCASSGIDTPKVKSQSGK